MYDDWYQFHFFRIIYFEIFFFFDLQYHNENIYVVCVISLKNWIFMTNSFSFCFRTLLQLFQKLSLKD